MTTYPYLIIGGEMNAAAAAGDTRKVDARVETVAGGKRPRGEGVRCYPRHSGARGVRPLNVRDRAEAARRTIAAPGPFATTDLKGRLPAGNTENPA